MSRFRNGLIDLLSECKRTLKRYLIWWLLIQLVVFRIFPCNTEGFFKFGIPLAVLIGFIGCWINRLVIGSTGPGSISCTVRWRWRFTKHELLDLWVHQRVFIESLAFVTSIVIIGEYASWWLFHRG